MFKYLPYSKLLHALQVKDESVRFFLQKLNISTQITNEYLFLYTGICSDPNILFLCNSRSVFINSKINLLEAALSDGALFIVYKYDRL